MGILGLDYGLKRVGVAVSFWQKKASPVGVFTPQEVWEKIKDWREKYQLEKIILGLPAGKMEKAVQSFGKKINYTYNIVVDYEDETLTSYEAKKMLVEMGLAKRKRGKLIDAYSAVLILEEYLRKHES